MSRKKVPVRMRVEKTQSRDKVNTPQLPLGMPAPPENLSDAELYYYRKYAESFEAMKILTQVDAESVGNLSRLAVMRDEFQNSVNEFGLMYETTGRNGKQIKVNPAADKVLKVINDMRLAMAEFGLSPSSRTKIKTEEGEQTSLPFTGMAKVSH